MAEPATADPAGAAEGPLSGLTVIEMAGLGPAPFCGMLLADLGAEVIRIDRPGSGGGPRPERDILNRGKRSIAVDLKQPAGAALVSRLVVAADALIEGYRPGVMERLGLGPEVCLDRNPGIVYGRMTGWGQDGPYANRAGHDLNYIAAAGALEPIGQRGGPPVPPANLVGDFGGGGLLLAFGLACALVETGRSGRGQVVDAAMIDGAALLTSGIHMLKATGSWSAPRGCNAFDGGAHFYNVYRCADDEYLTVTATEPVFYRALLENLGLDPLEFPQNDEQRWPELTARFAEIFRSRTRAEWELAFATRDVCYAPVLSPDQAPGDPHNTHRGTFVRCGDIVQPAPAPRFGRTPCAIRRPPPAPGAHTDELLLGLGVAVEEIAELRSTGAVS